MRLFLDDERMPPDSWSKYDHVVLRSYEKAIEFLLIYNNECPEYISFDHDLGGEKTGMDFAKWLVDRDLDIRRQGQYYIPHGFEFVVHSMNPIGRANITSYLSNYLHRREHGY